MRSNPRPAPLLGQHACWPAHNQPTACPVTPSHRPLPPLHQQHWSQCLSTKVGGSVCVNAIGNAGLCCLCDICCILPGSFRLQRSSQYPPHLAFLWLCLQNSVHNGREAEEPGKAYPLLFLDCCSAFHPCGTLYQKPPALQ